MSVLDLWFGWPDGQVWPNLLASALPAAGAWLLARKAVRKWSQRHADHHAHTHELLERLHERLDRGDPTEEVDP